MPFSLITVNLWAAIDVRGTANVRACISLDASRQLRCSCIIVSVYNDYIVVLVPAILFVGRQIGTRDMTPLSC